jgi:hypothetical protein
MSKKITTEEGKDHFRRLTACLSSDPGFKSSLTEALIEELNDALDTRAHRGQKTAFNAIRAEIHRRYKESNFSGHLIPEMDEHRKTLPEQAAQAPVASQAAKKGHAAISVLKSALLPPGQSALPNSEQSEPKSPSVVATGKFEVIPPAKTNPTHDRSTTHPDGREIHGGIRGNHHKTTGGSDAPVSVGPGAGEPAGTARRGESASVDGADVPHVPVGGRGNDDGPGAGLTAGAEAGKNGALSDPNRLAARKYADAAAKFEKCKVACQVMAGFHLIELQTALRLGQGQYSRSKPNDSVLIEGHKPNDSVYGHKSWAEFVKSEVGISDDTARNWMNMARAAAPRIRKETGFKELPLLNPSEMTAEQEKSVDAVVHKLADGKSQMDFMMELGLAKKPQGSGAKGGHKPAADPNKPKPENPEQQAAIDIWTPILRDLELEGLDEKSWAHLPDALLARLKGILIDLNKLVPTK